MLAAEKEKFVVTSIHPSKEGGVLTHDYDDDDDEDATKDEDDATMSLPRSFPTFPPF
jgi:hypothetical protein